MKRERNGKFAIKKKDGRQPIIDISPFHPIQKRKKSQGKMTTRIIHKVLK
jgi:hypothetical protein